MDKYDVEYRLAGSYVKKKIKDVIEDGFVNEAPLRYFMCEDKSRIEVPATAEFYFNPDRDAFIQTKRKEWEAEEQETQLKMKEKGNPLPGLAFPSRFTPAGSS